MHTYKRPLDLAGFVAAITFHSRALQHERRVVDYQATLTLIDVFIWERHSAAILRESSLNPTLSEDLKHFLQLQLNLHALIFRP